MESVSISPCPSSLHPPTFAPSLHFLPILSIHFTSPFYSFLFSSPSLFSALTSLCSLPTLSTHSPLLPPLYLHNYSLLLLNTLHPLLSHLSLFYPTPLCSLPIASNYSDPSIPLYLILLLPTTPSLFSIPPIPYLPLLLPPPSS